MTFGEIPQGAKDAYLDAEVCNDFTIAVRTCVEDVAGVQYTISGLNEIGQAMTILVNNYGTALYRFRGAVDQV